MVLRVFPCKFLQIQIAVISGHCRHYIIKICQTVTGMLTSQVYEFLYLIFGEFLLFSPTCAVPVSSTVFYLTAHCRVHVCDVRVISTGRHSTCYTQSPIIKNSPIKNDAQILGKFKERTLSRSKLRNA